jgi:hypothetical protein
MDSIAENEKAAATHKHDRPTRSFAFAERVNDQSKKTIHRQRTMTRACKLQSRSQDEQRYTHKEAHDQNHADNLTRACTHAHRITLIGCVLCILFASICCLLVFVCASSNPSAMTSSSSTLSSSALTSTTSASCVTEKKGDIFQMVPSTAALCHCVSADFKMGKGSSSRQPESSYVPCLCLLLTFLFLCHRLQP